MQSYELCCDMIDVVIDVSCIYGWEELYFICFKRWQWLCPFYVAFKGAVLSSSLQANGGWQWMRIWQGVFGCHQAQQHYSALFERGHKVPRSRLHPQRGELWEERCAVQFVSLDSGLIIQDVLKVWSCQTIRVCSKWGLIPQLYLECVRTMKNERIYFSLCRCFLHTKMCLFTTTKHFGKQSPSGWI